MRQPYRVEVLPAARRQLGRMAPAVQVRIGRAIDALASDPGPPGVRKLVGREDRYRIRIGDYRAVYRIEDDILFVFVVEVGHRREVYR